MTKENYCDFLDLPSRPKPRFEGLTSFFDYFIPIKELETLLEVAKDAMDWAKLIHIGLTANLPEGWLDRKLQLYREKDIKTYPGGIPYQVALVQNKAKEYFDWLAKMGFDAVEIAEDAMKSVMPKEKRGVDQNGHRQRA
jgi:phosphosulfolactate synthase